MITLYSYPELFGVADNNGYGLKIFAILKLAGVPFEHVHVVDTAAAPRGQLPFIVDDGEVIGDSGAIVAHLARRHADLDAALTSSQRDTAHMLTRMLDDLYWVISYSRWKDEAFWPQFRDAMLAEHPDLTVEMLENAKAYNAKRYFYQGVGRYEPQDAYARGLADLQVLANIVPEDGYIFGPDVSSIDAGVYGFIANSYFFEIDTPLRRFISARPHLVRHCEEIHRRIAS